MTNKERVHAALEGRPVDRYPQDHFTELTALPRWRLQQWLAESPEAHVAAVYAAPFELLQPQYSVPSRAWLELSCRQHMIQHLS